MTQTENEKELILGNKQLITLFFLVVAMCGAFFAFGYIIGRNGAKATPAVAADATAATGGTTSPTPAADTAAANTPSDSAAPAPAGDTPPPAVTETQPAQDTPSASTPFSAQAPPPAVAPRTPPPGAAQAATPLSAPTASAKTVVPPVPNGALEPGATYLQVTALRKSDADNLVKTLRELNFPALTAESSKSDLLRVLVGPYRQMTQVADAKARLKSLGFANAFVQK